MGSQPRDQTPVWRHRGKEQGTPGAELERPLRHKPAVSGLCPCLATPPHLLWPCCPAPRGPSLLGLLLALSSASLSLPFRPFSDSSGPQDKVPSPLMAFHGLPDFPLESHCPSPPGGPSSLRCLWFPGQSKLPGACRPRLR